eukprot:Lithocolla_globosa_v1_NODE_9439_length_707_cov_589.193252.p2 type:complete len:106 gc:universal NODE_9439_length_707_cov_589.193252:303-620(+)
MGEPAEERVLGARIAHTTTHEHSNNKPVDGNNTCHDNRNQGLHDHFRFDHGNTDDSRTAFGCTIGSTKSTQNHGTGTAHESKERSKRWTQSSCGHLHFLMDDQRF